MFSLIVGDQQWFFAIFQDHKPYSLSQITSHPVTRFPNTWDEVTAISQGLNLAVAAEQSVCIGLPLSQLYYQCLTVPTGIKFYELPSYVKLKCAHLMKVSSDEIAVDFHVIDEQQIWTVACLQSKLAVIQQLCQHAKLNLRKVDINFYALSTALEQLGILSATQWQSLNTFEIQHANQIDCFSLQQGMLLSSQQMTMAMDAEFKPSEAQQRITEQDAYQWMCANSTSESLTPANSFYALIGRGLIQRGAHDSL